jgi:hypothetical protein
MLEDNGNLFFLRNDSMVWNTAEMLQKQRTFTDQREE